MTLENPTINTSAERFITISIEKVIKLHEAGYTKEAISQYADLLSLYPENDEIIFRLAKLFQMSDRIDDAIPLLMRITSQSPYYAQALYVLGILLGNRGDFTGGADCLTRFLELGNGTVECYNNLARYLLELGRANEAYGNLLKSIELAPDCADTYNYLGNIFLHHWRLSEAGKHFRKVIELNPDYSSAYCNLAWVTTLEGHIENALGLYLKALELDAHSRIAANNYLLALNYSDVYSAEQVRDEHLRLAELYDCAADRQGYHRCQGQKIRVGYLSADFKAHSVAFFFEPVLRNHNKEAFEIFCYDLTTMPDATTRRMMDLGWNWRPVYGLSDNVIAGQVRTDGIDILVDLSGHTKGNRLGVCALCPAPVQVTWLGYPNTTGLKQINYRITDELADPTGMTEHLYAEQLVRLPRSFLCYTPPVSELEIVPLQEGSITFCCFNNYPKISDSALRLWARLLRALPDSLLSMKNGSFNDAGVRERLICRFAELGIDQSRLILFSLAESRDEHLRRYGACHIALDTFPYNGTTTTCEALWMGVPVVTLAGASHASRVGASILTHVGVPELVAKCTDEYVDIAIALAQNRERIIKYRQDLRKMFSASPLADAPGFTVDLEQSFRWMVEQVSYDTKD